MTSSEGTPRWVKVFGIAVLCALMAFAIVHLAWGGLGGHLHGPAP